MTYCGKRAWYVENMGKQKRTEIRLLRPVSTVGSLDRISDVLLSVWELFQEMEFDGLGMWIVNADGSKGF